MHHWDKNTAGRLERVSAPVEQGCEVSLNCEQMEPPPEEQQSQQRVKRDPNAYRSIRDHIHPSRVSAPSCIIPPAEDVTVKPYLVPLLPTFHGMENENPYTHIREFEEVCKTFKEGATDMDLLKLKAFPLTLKDKAKIWLNSLRPRTIRNWTEMQAEFLKNFFSMHRTNSLKRQIYTFAANDSEKFYQCYERYIETISALPHHGFDTWMLVNHFYDGMSHARKQLLETMCGGDFLSKNIEEAMDFMSYVAETSKAWDEPNPREAERMRSASSSRGSMYLLQKDMELKVKLSTFARRVEELEGKRLHEVQVVTEVTLQAKLCFIYHSTEHVGEKCPIILAVREMFFDQANFVGQSKPPPNAPYKNTYNPNWRNYPNLSWKPDPPIHIPFGARQ